MWKRDVTNTHGRKEIYSLVTVDYFFIIYVKKSTLTHSHRVYVEMDLTKSRKNVCKYTSTHNKRIIMFSGKRYTLRFISVEVSTIIGSGVLDDYTKEGIVFPEASIII